MPTATVSVLIVGRSGHTEDDATIVAAARSILARHHGRVTGGDPAPAIGPHRCAASRGERSGRPTQPPTAASSSIG